MALPNLLNVGFYKQKYNILSGQSLPIGPIFQSSGLAADVQKHHPGELHNLSRIRAVLSSPDYIGHNPKEADSVEFVKCYAENVLVCVKLDQKNGYLYVASVYEISSTKLNNRIFSGRLKKI